MKPQVDPVRHARAAADSVASSEVDAKHDVLVIGAGCAGMRAAIEAHDAGADVAIVSKLHPTRSHSGAAEGGINAALGNSGDDRPREPRVRHRQGLGLPRRPGLDRDLHPRGAGRHLPARALGRGLLARRGRQARAAAVRRRRLAAHGLRGRHHGPRPDPGALRAAGQARHQGLRGVLRLAARRARGPLPGRDRLGSPPRRPEGARRQDRPARHRRRRAGSTARRRTPTPAPATACRWRCAPGCR